MKGKLDFLVKSNPFGTGEEEAQRPQGRVPRTAYGQLDRKEVSRQVSMAFRVLGAKGAGKR